MSQAATTHVLPVGLDPAPHCGDGGVADLNLANGRLAEPGLNVRGFDVPRDARVFVTAVCVLLAGYAVMGRGFAYLGVKPLYVGEVVLMLGLCTVAPRMRVWNVLGSPLAACVWLFVGWGLCRSVPYLSDHGVYVLRDSVVWGYAIFALLIGGTLMAWPSFLTLLLRNYLKFAGAFPLLMVVLWPAQRALWSSLPRWPNAFGGGQPLFCLLYTSPSPRDA